MRTAAALIASILLVGCAIPHPPNPKIDAVRVTDDPNAITGCRFILNIETWADRKLTSSKDTEVDNGIYSLKREAYLAGGNLVLFDAPVRDGTSWHIKGKAFYCPEEKPAPPAK